MDRQDNFIIATNLVVNNAGGPVKSGSPTTNSYRGLIALKKTPQNTSLIHPYPNIFTNFYLDCSQLPLGYYCFIVQDADPYTHCLIMHKNIPIFWFLVPTSSTNKLYEMVQYENTLSRQGIKLEDCRKKLDQKMTPKPSKAKSSGEKILEKLAEQIFRAWPSQIRQCFENPALLNKSVELYTSPKPSLQGAKDDLIHIIFQLAKHGLKNDGKSRGIILHKKKQKNLDVFKDEFKDLWLILVNKLINSTFSDPYIIFSLFRTFSRRGSTHRPPSWFFITKDSWCITITHNTHASHLKDIPEYSFSAKTMEYEITDPDFITYLGNITYESFYKNWKDSFHFPLLIKGTGDVQLFQYSRSYITHTHNYTKTSKNDNHNHFINSNYPSVLSEGNVDYFMFPIPDFIRQQFSDKFDVFSILDFIYYELEQMKYYV